METRKCDICNVEVQRASYAKHLRSKMHEDNQRIIPSNFFKESEVKPKTVVRKKVPTLKELSMKKLLTIQKPSEIDSQLAQKMINPYYFSQRLNLAYKIELDSHNINHLNSKITVRSKYDLRIENREINNIFKEMALIYARLIGQYKFKYQVVFSALFEKMNEFGYIENKTEMYISLKLNHVLTLSDLDNLTINSQVESQIENKQMKESGWVFDKLVSMTIYFYKTNELNGSSYVKLPLKTQALLNIQNKDKLCFLWSILAHLHPCKNGHPERTSSYVEYFNELNIDGFDFTNGFKTSDVKRFETANNLSINIFELKFNLEGKHKLVPIELSKNEHETTIDLLIYKNHYVLIKKLHTFIGNSKSKFICRRCLSCFEHEHVLMKHKDRCEQQDFTAIKLPLDKQLNWKKHYQKIPLYFRIYADFECNNSPVESNVGLHTTNIYKQNLVCNGYYIVSNLPSVLQSGYVSNFGPNNVDWFVDEIIKLENKMNFYFKNTNVELNMLPEDEYNFEKSDKCWFCELPFESAKVGDHRHLTGKYRGAAHESCNINVKKQQSNFIPVMFHNFSKYDCHLFFKTLLCKSKSQKLKVIPKTNEEYISVNFGCIRFIDSYRFLQSSLDSLVKSLQENDLVLLKKEFPEDIDLLNKKLAYPYEYFKSFEDYEVPFDSLDKKDYYSILTNIYPHTEEIERTNKIIDVFGVKNGKELTELYLKTDVILLADVFENFVKVSVKEFGINPLYSVSLPGYTWQCGLKYTSIKLDTLQDKDMILLLENNIRGGISSVMGDRYVKSDDYKKIFYIDANNLYGYAMSQSLPYKDLKFDSIDIETILSTPDDSEIGYFVEVDLKYPDEIKDKTKNFPFCPENKFSPIDNFTDYMDLNKPESYVKCKKLICDWTDKQKYLVHYRLLKFYVKHGMEITKVHEVISFK